MRIPHFTPPASFGSRSQVGATVSDLKDVLGNQDGIWGNESAAAGTLGTGFDRNPLSERMQQALGVGFSVDDEMKLLSDFRVGKEKQWGQPVSDLSAQDLKRGGALFLVQKSIQLTRMDRGPATVKDAYVSAKGSFDGKPLQDRAIFTQRYLPTAEPSGQVIVLSPGFQETGRNFEKQIADMNAQGHEVITLDHQWAGQSDGSPGGLDRGAGVARDVAAVASYASEIAEKQYGEKGKVTLFGNSMGAGPGVLGALTLTAAKGADGNPRLQLFDDDGRAKDMPKNMGAVLQSPFLGTTKNALNSTLAFASHLPFVNRLQNPALGLPQLTEDRGAAQRGAQSSVLEDVRAQMNSMTSAQPDIDLMWTLLQDGLKPKGDIQVVIGDKDPLASPDKAVELGQLFDNVDVKLVRSDNHVFEQSDKEMHYGLDALKRLLAD